MSAPDIVERLERLVACDPACRGRCKACPEEEAREGAREITALREQLKEAQNWGKPVAWMDADTGFTAKSYRDLADQERLVTLVPLYAKKEKGK